MTSTRFKLLFCLPFCAGISFAQVSLDTSFDGSEGYTSGNIDDAIQTGAPNFNAPSYGFYLPGGGAPNFGTLKLNPTSQAKMWTADGTGAIAAGESWVTTMDFTFEGVETDVSGFLPSIGFTPTKFSNNDSMLAGIQRTSTQATNGATAYKFYTAGGSGGYKEANVQYSDIGDSTSDADDLTDNLRYTLTLTKSATTNLFEAEASLTNLDTSTIVATLTTTYDRANAWTAGTLHGYISSGNQTDSNNFDLVNIDSYTLNAVPEPSQIALVLGSLAFGYIIIRRRRA